MLGAADGIPLERYAPAAAQTVLTQSALYGLSRLFLLALCALTLVRYRSAVSFMLAVLLLNQLATQLV